jgi:hypothetical protein
MCDNCFLAEIKSFPDETTWTSFDLELTKKLGQGKMKNIKFVHDGQRDKDDGQYIYECLACGEKWKMKDPDNAFRGYFLKLSTLEKVTTNLNWGQIFWLGLIGLIIIRVIYWLLTN